MYGLAGHRSILRTRALSFSMYVVFLLAAVVLLPLVLAGPGLVDRALPDRIGAVGYLYWPVVLVGTAAALATLFHLAVPIRHRWRGAIPGAVLTLLLWLGGSALLRLILGLSIGSTSIYGPLAAPIAVLLWLYLINLALLVGAAFNASLEASPLPRSSQNMDPVLEK
jgi:membrane protein